MTAPAEVLNAFRTRGIEKIAAAFYRRNQTTGQAFSSASLDNVDPLFWRYHDTGIRVKVQLDGYSRPRFGSISHSLGWAPVLLLMPRIDSRGSSITIGPKDRIIAVSRGSGYESVT